MIRLSAVLRARGAANAASRIGWTVVVGAAVVASTVFGSLLVATATAAPGPQRVEVRIHHSRFLPATVTVLAGRPVEFVIRNDDPIGHEWIVADAGTHAAHRTGTEPHHGVRPTEVSLGPGQTVTTTVTFEYAVTLQVICHLPGHEAYGMVGVVIVRPDGD